MPHSNSQSVITIRLHSLVGRALVVLPIVLALLGAWFAVRWYVGDTIAEYASTNEAGSIELARLGVRWAPADPFAHWRLGALAEKEFSANNMAEAVREYREAVRLSPSDYRYWGELGRALEASGDSDGAEQALRRAVELAPSYSYPRWYLGNLLLREGKQEEAFQELARAAAADGQLQPQVFNLAWQFFEGNVNEITRVACPSAGVRAEFALYLAGLKKFDEAIRIWGTLSRTDQRSLSSTGDRLKQSLIDSKQFRVALKVLSDIAPEDTARPVAEQFTNGGFENPLAHASVNSFDWSIGSGAQVQSAIDAVSHNGHHSLRIIFKVPNKLDVIPVSQTVVVEPNMQYHFECFARTEALDTGSAPVLMISDAADNKALAGSAPLPTGTNDWQKISFDFKTKPNSDGVTLTLVRPPCSVGPICPILGTVWYDDFNLQRAGGRTGAR